MQFDSRASTLICFGVLLKSNRIDKEHGGRSNSWFEGSVNASKSRFGSFVHRPLDLGLWWGNVRWCYQDEYPFWFHRTSSRAEETNLKKRKRVYYVSSRSHSRRQCRRETVSPTTPFHYGGKSLSPLLPTLIYPSPLHLPPSTRLLLSFHWPELGHMAYTKPITNLIKWMNHDWIRMIMILFDSWSGRGTVPEYKGE